jgi:predicted small integral membrane protein
MDADDESTSRLGELRGSARGWHGVQLAVLGFIGLCGVLQRDAGTRPGWLQTLAALLVLLAFALACVATVLVALAAWPVYAPAARPDTGPAEIARTSARLRLGIGVTFVAVAILALATSSTWWPHSSGAAGAASVEVSTPGGVVCGELGTPSALGRLAVSAGGRLVELALSDVTSVRPVTGCG